MNMAWIRSRQSMSAAVLALAAGAVLAAQPVTRPEPAKPASAPQPAEPGRPVRAPGQGNPPGLQPGGEQLSLETSMKMLNRGMRELKDKIGAPDAKADNLRWISTMERACLNAKAAAPRDIPDRADEFRTEQVGLMRLLLDMEVAVIEGKSDGAQAIYAKVEAYRDAAHKKFDVKLDEKPEVDDAANGKNKDHG
jgi:hypothetical protein